MLSSSGTEVVAFGTFKPLLALPMDAGGQQVGANELLLRGNSSGNLRVGHVVVHDPALGQTNAGVSVGQASWRLPTDVESFPASDPPAAC
jgi:hypothetical protein